MASIRMIILAGVLATAACTTSNAPPSRDVAVRQPQNLLSHARTLLRDEGCAAAAPAYRVIAAFGDGYEAAQYELGDCLLEMALQDPALSLDRDEGLLWLRRAAWSGEPRAQHALATGLSNAKSFGLTETSLSPEEAYGWALVYAVHPNKSLYSLPDVPEPVISHLESAMSSEDIRSAENFAKNFEVVKMAAFIPPPGGAAARSTEKTRQGRPAGQGKRRRFSDMP